MDTIAITAERHVSVAIVGTKSGRFSRQARPVSRKVPSEIASARAGAPLMLTPATPQILSMEQQQKQNFAQLQPNYFQVCAPQGPHGLAAAQRLHIKSPPRLHA